MNQLAIVVVRRFEPWSEFNPITVSCRTLRGTTVFQATDEDGSIAAAQLLASVDPLDSGEFVGDIDNALTSLLSFMANSSTMTRIRVVMA